MAQPNLRLWYKLVWLALSLFAAGCTHNTTTQKEPLPSVLPIPRVNDIYANRVPEVVRYDRYTLASSRPIDAQRDPLNQIVDITMPTKMVRSVGDGFRYVLLESGYSLCSTSSSVFTELLNKPLPGVQRSIGPLRLSDVLQILAGPAWCLRVDDVNREICFTLRDAYQNLTVDKPIVPAKVTIPAKNSTHQSGNFLSGSSTIMAAPVVTTPLVPLKSTLKPENIPVPSPVITPVGQLWQAEVGSTLKETLNRWAGQAKCTNGGNWVVIWSVLLDYRIDAPLAFHGNFESALVQIFELYRPADKPLFAQASRLQCLVAVSDISGGR
ncbi:TcpQ domain-containing protein [Yersinia enterocolitica]|uniref:PFGI-1 class ICE element type IV pilus protein PilL2 n=1 Tax=Yersinia enterocolitica TaxID=630 RepID=UPI00398D594E